MNTIKTASLSGEPAFVLEDGVQFPYMPKAVKTARKAFGASLHLIFQHVADIHILMLTILSETYGHSIDDMVAHIHGDPRYMNMLVNPLLTGMGYVEEEDLSKAMEKLSLAEPKPELAPEPPKPAPKKLVKKTLKKAVVEADD